MVRTKYSKLTSKQKLEIIEYWTKYHYPYSTVCDYFKTKWNRDVNMSTVADIIQQWKKNRKIRGVSKTSYVSSILLESIQKTIRQVNDLGYSISHQSLHAICLGELEDCEQEASSFSLDSLEMMLTDNQLQLAPCFSVNHVDVDNSFFIDHLREVVHSTSLSSVLFLDSFYLFFRCLPYKPLCYSSDNRQFREKMEVLLAFSLDGSHRSPLFIHGHRFSTQIDKEWSLSKHKKRREVKVMSISSLDLYDYISSMDQLITSHHVLIMQNIHHLIDYVDEDSHSIHFHSSEQDNELVLNLQHLQVVLVNPLLFSQVSPFNCGIHSFFVKSYRIKLIHEVVHLQQNKRGYKRILPIETCYDLLSSSWKGIPDRVFQEASLATKLTEYVVNDSVPVYDSQIDSQLVEAITEFEHSFKLISSEIMPISVYSVIEAIPYLSGIASIQECLRNGYSSILFNHSHYPISPLFPDPEFFLNERNVKDMIIYEEAPILTIPEIRPSLQMDCMFQPSGEMVQRFCSCLDLFLQNSNQFTEDDRLYYESLKERICSYYCTI